MVLNLNTIVSPIIASTLNAFEIVEYFQYDTQTVDDAGMVIIVYKPGVIMKSQVRTIPPSDLAYKDAYVDNSLFRDFYIDSSLEGVQVRDDQVGGDYIFYANKKWYIEDQPESYNAGWVRFRGVLRNT